MKKNNTYQAMVCVSLLSLILISGACKDFEKSASAHRIYYRNFDLFNLKGIDSLPMFMKSDCVEIHINKSVPNLIRYHNRNNPITLVLKDSFTTIDNRLGYIYSTSNFHGGKAGSNKIYTGRFEEYEDLIYITKSDTIICKSNRLPYNQNCDYTLYLFFRDRDSIIRFQSSRNCSLDKNLNRGSLYSELKDDLTKKFQDYSLPHIRISKLP